MPIYEFRCTSCGARSESVAAMGRAEPPAYCPRCGGTSFRRLFSRFAYHRSESDRLAGVDPDGPADEAFYRDPRNVGLRTKARMQRMGVDLGDRFEEVVERGRSGELIRDMMEGKEA